MKLVEKFLTISLLVGCSFQAIATTGGDEKIEFLGYEPNDKKVYVLRHFEDGRGRLPQLYYFDFKGKNPSKLVEVESLYINAKTGKIDYDDHDGPFYQKLNKITRHLLPLNPIKPANVSLKILSKKQQNIRDEYMYTETGIVKRYQYRYQLSSGGYKSSTHSATTFSPSLSVSQAFIVPQQNNVVVAVKYKNAYYESGYYGEDPILLTK